MNAIGRGAVSEAVSRNDAPIIRNEIREIDGLATTFAVIDSRKLERECFVRVIKASYDRISITAYGSVQEWSASLHGDRPCVILLNIGARRAGVTAVGSALESLVAEAGDTPVIVLSESEELRDMIAAVDCGARGYIPASVGVDVIIEAARLASAGGIFLPASSLLALRDSITKEADNPIGIKEHFTSRQAAVADALRRGKANKTIAYELNMCESTVKVHIRTIMKKLRASNRTQAAYKLNALFPRDQDELG
jgi:DNA-binding NarL/FixJ family response regulator